MPAEWERQSMIQLTWPHEGTDWRPMIDEITAVYVKMAAAISRRERLLVVCPDSGNVRRMLSLCLTAAEMDNITFYSCPTDDTWARDHGLISLVGTAYGGHCCEPLLLDFRFNGWGGKFPSDRDNAVSSSIYGAGLVRGKYEDNLDFVLEGGSIESDGQGTVFTTTRCHTAAGRNGQPKAQIEQELLRRLRAKRIVWIDHGGLAGDDTDGHIDTLVRVAPDYTLLYTRAREGDEHYAELMLMESELRALRTLDGQPYRLVQLPLPSAICDDNGCRLPATYANFLVINGAVLVPVYGQPATDRQALQLIGRAFPDRETVAIDARPIICQHGSVHCCAMQYY